MRTLSGRLAVSLLLVSLASAGAVPDRPDTAQARETGAAQGAGMAATPPPVVSVLVAASPSALGAAPLVVPLVAALSRQRAGDRLSDRIARPPFVARSAPAILRV